MPISNPPPSAVITAQGTYAGNDAVNRAIPHGLAATPKLVIIVLALVSAAIGDYVWTIKTGIARVNLGAGGANSSLSVTAVDATNFYVGNATNYTLSANLAGSDYYWIAIS